MQKTNIFSRKGYYDAHGKIRLLLFIPQKVKLSVKFRMQGTETIFYFQYNTVVLFTRKLQVVRTHAEKCCLMTLVVIDLL